MRPLFHPAIEEVTVEGLLHALSDPVRVAIYARTACADAVPTCSTFLEVNDRTIPKSTLSLHLKVLREAGLIRGERVGVEMRLTTRCAEINQRFPGLLQAIFHAYEVQSAAAARVKKAAARKAARTRRA